MDLGELSSSDAGIIVAAFEADLAAQGIDGVSILSVGITNEIVRVASTMGSVHRLGTSQSIELATALAVRDVEPNCKHLLSVDETLVAAACVNGFMSYRD